MALNNESDFLNLTLYSLEAFKTKVIGPIKAIVQHPRYQIEQWLHADDYSAFQLPLNGRKPALSIKDRMMRCITFNINEKVKLLEIL